jgi:hypothetical protein
MLKILFIIFIFLNVTYGIKNHSLNLTNSFSTDIADDYYDHYDYFISNGDQYKINFLLICIFFCYFFVK